MPNNKSHIKLNKFLSLILRHNPKLIGIKLDENGWTDVKILISNMTNFDKPIDIDLLKKVVATDNKTRYSFNNEGNKIRANQGHSVKVNLGYKPVKPPKILFHGTGSRYVDNILKTGLNKRKRHHVHLSTDKETAIKVGQRHGKPVVLEILSGKMYKDGIEFFLSENGVWLTDNVSIKYIRTDFSN